MTQMWDAGVQAAGRNSLKPMTFVRHTGFGECELVVQLKATHMGDERPLASAQDMQLVSYSYKSCNTTMSVRTYTTVTEQVQRYGLHLIDTATNDTQMQCIVAMHSCCSGCSLPMLPWKLVYCMDAHHYAEVAQQQALLDKVCSASGSAMKIAGTFATFAA